MKSSHASQQSCTQSSPKKLQIRFTQANQRHDRERLWKYRNTKISGWRLDVQKLLLLLLATRDLAGQDCMIFSSHIYDILFFLLQTSPSSSSSSAAAAASSLGTPPHMVAYAWTLWETVTSRTCRSSDDACCTHGGLHAWRTLARSLARSLARLRNYQRKTSFGRLENLVVSEQVWEDGVLAARTCPWRSGAAEWTSEKRSLESLSSYSKLLRDVLDFNCSKSLLVLCYKSASG